MLPVFLLVTLGAAAPAPLAPAASTPPPSATSASAVAGPPSPATPEVDADDTETPDNKDSEELEEMRALEEVTLDPAAKPSAAGLQSVRRLGMGNPLRARMEDDAFDELNPGDEGRVSDLPRITDLGTFDVSRVAADYDIPVEMQPLVAQYIQFFQGPGRKWFRKWMSRSSRYIPMMAPILEEHGVPRDLVYLSMIESGFSTQAYSWAKASGPWQFISTTGKLYGLRQDFWVDERRDPVKSTNAAARYLKRLRADLGHWYLAWAGYNAGGERVRKVVAKRGTADFWQVSDGKGLAKETKHYVPKLIACALVAKHPRSFGFTDDEFAYESPAEFEEVKLADPTDLEVVARAAQVPVEDVKELNPELKRWCTPPASPDKPYLLRLPKGSAATFTENYPKLAPRERLTFKVHRIRRGETLSQIARIYHTAPEAILQLNQLKNARRLKVSSDLVIPIAPGKAGAVPDDAALASVLERQATKARRSGYISRPEEEVPAGTPRAPLAQGPIKSEQVGGRERLTYGVQEGDSLWSLGQHFNCSVADLREWNHLGPKARGLKVGATLSIYPGAKVPLENRGGTLVAQKDAGASHKTHLLAAGETLWSVAQQYGVRVEDLKKWNGIKHDRSVRAGQMLSVAAP